MFLCFFHLYHTLYMQDVMTSYETIQWRARPALDWLSRWTRLLKLLFGSCRPLSSSISGERVRLSPSRWRLQGLWRRAVTFTSPQCPRPVALCGVCWHLCLFCFSRCLVFNMIQKLGGFQLLIRIQRMFFQLCLKSHLKIQLITCTWRDCCANLHLFLKGCLFTTRKTSSE